MSHNSKNEQTKQFLIVKEILKNNPDCKMLGPWLFYCSENIMEKEIELDGKWMIFNRDIIFLNNLCKSAVHEGIVTEAKHSYIYNSDDGDCVSCFYLNYYDKEAHKKIIQFFKDNKAIPKTKNGRLYNIAFKLNSQTREKEYGTDFKAKMSLSDFLNLETGEFLV